LHAFGDRGRREIDSSAEFRERESSALGQLAEDFTVDLVEVRTIVAVLRR
jgi:hypothetical protein